MDGRTDGRTHTRTHAHTDARTDNVKTVYPPQTKFAGGIKKSKCEACCEFYGFFVTGLIHSLIQEYDCEVTSKYCVKQRLDITIYNYLNKFEIAITDSFLVIFYNN